MTSDETIDVTQIGQHAQTMGALASAVGQTVGTISRPPNPLMYGALMSPVLLAVMSGITAAGVQYLQGATHAVQETADGLSRTRDAYAHTEQRNVEAAKRALPR